MGQKIGAKEWYAMLLKRGAIVNAQPSHNKKAQQLLSLYAKT